MKEAELSITFQKYFSRFFHIETEVSPVNSRKRLDLLLTLKTSKDYVFGVELKSPEHKQGTQIEAWLNQAHGYSKQNFNIRGYERAIPILIYPALSSLFFQRSLEHEPIIHNGEEYFRPKHDSWHTHSNVNIFTGMLNLGEIRKVYERNYTGYAFIFRNQLLWFEKMNPQQHSVNYKKYFHYSHKNQ